MRKTLLVAGLGMSLSSVVGCTDDKDPTTSDTAANDTGAVDEGTPDEGDPDEGTPDEGSGDGDDTGTTDDTGTPPSGPSITDIQTHVIPTGESVTLEGVVVTASYTPNQAGFFIAEPAGGPNSGLWVYAPYMSEDITVAPGDVLTITGTTAEYAPSSDDEGDTGMTDAPDLPDSMTQTQLTIADPADVTVTSSGEIPASVTVGAMELSSPDTAEQYEGVLVTIEAPTVATPYESGVFYVVGGATVGNLYIDFDYVRLGDSFSSITGVIYSANGEYRVSPRSNADVLGHADTCASCSTESCIGDLSAGDLVITELMPNPDACGDRDNAGEYIEVYNASGMSVDLNCLELTDGGDHYGFVEESTVVGAGAYAVLQRRGDEYCYDAAVASAGAATAVYRKKVSLNNTEDSITLSYGDVVFDSVSYTAEWPFSEGVSIEFSNDLLGESPTEANDSVEAWCGSESMIEGTTDMGSPGVANGGCTSVLGK